MTVDNAMTVGLIGAWIAVIILMLLVLALYRQWGLMLVSGKERIEQGGLDIGSPMPDIEDMEVDLKWPEEPKGAAFLLVLFTIPGCPVCTTLKRDLYQSEPLATPVLLFDRTSEAQGSTMDGTPAPPGLIHIPIEDRAIEEQFAISQAPFAYLIADDGKILNKALVNRPDQLRDIIKDSRHEAEILPGSQ